MDKELLEMEEKKPPVLPLMVNPCDEATKNPS